MKIRALAFVLVAAGCASAQNPDSLGGSSSPDLASGDTGGNGGDVDMSGGGGGGGGGGGAVDMATTVPPDLAQSPPDLAQPPPDLAPLCSPPSGSACVVYPQCGCSSTQSCDITGTSGAGVCVVAGTTPNWNACTGSGQCMKGSTCVHGVCTPFCAAIGTPSADCGGNAECYQLQDSNQNPIPNDKVCSNNCDPTNPQNATGFSPCGPNVNCYPDSDHYAWCIGPTKASGTQGADCTNGISADPTLCAVGYYCVAGSFSGTCYKMCHKAQTGECPGSTTCTSFSTKQYAGSAEIGYCK